MRLRGIKIGGDRRPAAPAGQAVAVDPADEPGHTRSFTVPEMSLPEGPEAEEHVAVYRAGQPHPQVGSERLPWRELLRGIVRHPTRTFAQMRAHQVWGPALVVSAVYGLLASFAFGDTSSEVLHSTFAVALTILLSSAVGFVVAGLMFGSVTHVLARRLGGDGSYAPTVGLAMLISWLTDAPRLLLAFFLPSGNAVVQLLGWVTWALCAWLLASMLRQLHDLPWGKALTAASLQLVMLLVVIKLPTLG
ncbi:Yip1 family protein [Streptacidiphilus jiangxiensis]|uniref:Yip1 domain-containing protein n=1 Tax=Streptacidiphilus jiangxiensis TaxID=235985 RepID=A0A1H7JN78_STRJI|nr:Yip1 family protein [Streptacidiphilus jiangxiensis]SEK75337.1 Yip1 domain-containing protein [Streptacidiphilus jiangxiensis]